MNKSIVKSELKFIEIRNDVKLNLDSIEIMYNAMHLAKNYDET